MADFSVGSYCSKLTKLDAIEPNLTSGGFLDIIKALYMNSGCTAFFDMISDINSLPYPYGCTGHIYWSAQQSNPAICLEIAKRKARKDFCECMLIQNCGFEEMDFGIKYGCMDAGNRDLSYINNRGTWNFLLKNNTTSSGVVARPDGTQLPGLQMGSAYPPPLVPGTLNPYPPVPALNYDGDATVDIGNCVYVDNYHIGNPSGGLPYHLEGCMNSTPDPTGGHPDINGHGTGAIYDCPISPGSAYDSLTTPAVPDPCTYPCAPGQGYLYSNYDPCANFSCSHPSPNALPPYSSDPQYATDYNIGHTYWDNTNTTSYKFGSNTYASVGDWGPFGYQRCCIAPELPQSNPDITYDFRYGQMSQVGGMTMYSSMSSYWGAGIAEAHKIGGPYFSYTFNRWDVVGNTQFVGYGTGGVIDYSMNVVYGTTSSSSLQQQVYNTLCTSCGSGTMPVPPCPDTEIVRFRVYDVHKTLIWDGDYKYTCHQLQVCPAAPSVNELCFMKSLMLHLVTERYSINPGQIIDLCTIPGVTGTPPPPYCNIYHDYPQGVPYGSGYIRLDSAISGTTVDLGNIWEANPGFPQTSIAPRIPSTHWTTPRGNTANLTNMWTGDNLNWDPVTNPFTVGTHIPHACHDCSGSFSILAHWLEPGPGTWTPGDYFYNNPNLLTNPSSVHASHPTALINCPRASIIGGGSEGEIGSHLSRDCEEGIIINTKITYSEDENQEVTIIPSSANTVTPISTQTTVPPPTTPIPPPTTPIPPPTTMTGGSGY